MTEFFLPFLIGYGVARVLSFMLDANRESSKYQLLERNIVLKWDNGSFGWRPCTLSTVKDPAAKYMIASPVDFEVLSIIRDISFQDE